MTSPAPPRPMTLYRAVALCEGFGEGEHASREDVLEAWQWLITTGHAWTLQGYYGRMAIDLLAAGHCHLPTDAREGSRVPS